MHFLGVLRFKIGPRVSVLGEGKNQKRGTVNI